jgi:glycosyltransferase involved in cell wall biosynthesis
MKAQNAPAGARESGTARLLDHTSSNIPRTTIIVPSYNYERFVLETLDSIAAQTAPVDLVVVDDGSTDASVQTIADWMKLPHAGLRRTCLARHDRNRGLGAARNTAFGLARTPFVFPLDSDNALYPRCIEMLEAALDHSEGWFAYSCLERHGLNARLMNIHGWDRERLAVGGYIDAMALIRRTAWEAVGGYAVDEVIRFGWEDYDFWLAIAEKGGYGVLVPEILGRYRVHGASMMDVLSKPNERQLRMRLRARHGDLFRPVRALGGDAHPSALAPPAPWPPGLPYPRKPDGPSGGR